MNLLANLFSYGDGLKRKIGGLLDDPMGTASLGATRMAEDQNSLLSLMDQSGYTPGSRSVLQTPQEKQLARNLLADKATEAYGGLLGATVWHGSPHKFDKFDSSKIGTGEGAQAYGHGLYLAESPDVAAMYREKLTDPAFKYAGMNAAKVRINEKLAKRLENTDPAKAAKLRADSASLSDPAGAIYKVDLPDEHIAKMLDYDKPLSQQAHAINPFIDAQKASLESLPSSFGPTVIPREVAADIVKNKTGAQAYDLLKQQYGAAKAADMLRQAGIPGIRYLDGGSRDMGAGTSNYVIFPKNEGLLQILERNGSPIN